MKIISYQVYGLACGGCVNRVKNVLQTLGQTVNVSLDPPEATFTQPTVEIAQRDQSLKILGHYELSIKAPSASEPADEKAPSWLTNYRQLFLVFSYLILVCLLVEWAQGAFELPRFMPNFMAGFFLPFSFYKLLDLAGFANSYAMYDLLAKRIPQYG